MQSNHEFSYLIIIRCCIIFSKYDHATKTFTLSFPKLLAKSSLSFLHDSKFFHKMLTEDEEVRLQVGMLLQLGVLRYLDIKVKEINTFKHFFNC